MLKLGESALAMRGVTHAVQSVKPWLPASVSSPMPIPAKIEKRRPVPFAAMVVAMVVATAGAIPTIVGLPQRFAQLLLTLMHTAPIVSRSGMQLFEQGLGAAGLTAMFGCATLFVCAGVAVSRFLPRTAAS
jgi:hypothetical protein